MVKVHLLIYKVNLEHNKDQDKFRAISIGSAEDQLQEPSVTLVYSSCVDRKIL